MGTRLPFADLLESSSLTIATVSSAGQPHAAALYFANDQHLNFYFISKPDSQHSLDLADNSSVGVSISVPISNWKQIHGLQMHGKVREIKSTQAQLAAAALYLAKFPFIIAMENEIMKNRWYMFSPVWLRWIDNRVHFGYKQEWSGDELAQLCEYKIS
ncbi:MAG: pyridoxamine 5'-phosphate oxidase family protein [Chloroflexi bacterium]|nr:pyridoxamine 5'-phosphate oxidase family protein [Chloroflexota bacterium]